MGQRATEINSVMLGTHQFGGLFTLAACPTRLRHTNLNAQPKHVLNCMTMSHFEANLGGMCATWDMSFTIMCGLTPAGITL